MIDIPLIQIGNKIIRDCDDVVCNRKRTGFYPVKISVGQTTESLTDFGNDGFSSDTQKVLKPKDRWNGMMPSSVDNFFLRQ